MCAITRSPGMKPCTPSPTCLTTPAISLPGEKGSSGLNWYLFWMRRTSGKFTPLAFTETRSCPLPGAGDGTSSTTSESGGPQSLHSTALMRAFLRSCGHHSRPVASATIVGLPCIAPEGGFHGRRHHRQARAAIRGVLAALPRLPRRFPGRQRRPRSFDDRALRRRLLRQAERRAGRASRFLGRSQRRRPAHTRDLEPTGFGAHGARRHSGADRIRRDGHPVLAFPRRHARENAGQGEDRHRRWSGATLDRAADRALPRLLRLDPRVLPRVPLDRFRQAQAGLARQDCGHGRSARCASDIGGNMSWGFWIVVGVVVAVAVWLISIYNGLVAQRNRFKNAFAQIDVQLKRRYDLIPNLVETAKGYIKHERGTLEAVIAARNGAQSANQRAAADPANAEAMKHMAAARWLALCAPF